ncbi:HAMP domain-containing sensor histidine kinase [Brucella sp. BE17]|uniref:sensor histidine kinase n=1 Tax=Brucella sp. BE17 TaxID=3142977 RepID=UPI0031BA250C
MRMLNGLLERFCRRVTVEADATARRVAISLVGMPVLFFSAALAVGPVSTPVEFAILAASIAGVAMTFCAISMLGAPAIVLGSVTCAIYGMGLAALGVFTEGNAALWLMAAALPLEVWFVLRKPVAAYAGAIGALLMLALFMANGSGLAGGSLISVTIMVLYAASLPARSAGLSARSKAEQPEMPAVILAEGDVRFVLDNEGMVISVDDATAKCLGVKTNMLEGTALLDRVHVGDRVHYLSLLADLRSGKRSERADLRLRALQESAPVFHAWRMEGSRQGTAIALIGRSLACEQKLHDEIAALKAELKSERAGKGRVLAAVSHELRTPLNSIIGFSDMLTHGLGGELANDRQREYAGLIHRSGHYLLELVNAVLDNSQLESGTYAIAPQIFDFRDAADLCASVMLPQAEKKSISFCHRVGRDIGELNADRRAVQQILLNLAANAIKFTEPGGCVTIDAARVVVEERAVLELHVSDTGIGIAPEDLQRLGAPFTRADNSYTRAQEGSGLGLSVVKGLVELHQGTMVLKSCPGEGTVVTIRLPLAGPQFVVGEDEESELGTVIEIHRHQGEKRNDWQNEEERKQGQNNAKTRKTA